MPGPMEHERITAWWRLPLRALLGIAFIHHALPKFGPGHAGLASMLQHLGVPTPALTAWIVTLVELVGGACLILGALIPIATTLLIIEMIVAMLRVHLPHGFDAVNIVGSGPAGPQFGMPGVELNLLYIAALLALLLGGAGPWSVDRALRRRLRDRRSWADRDRRPVHA